MKPLRIAGVIRESIVDGPGWRFVVFAQGCPHRCPGCHNPKTHDFEDGTDVTPEKIMEEAKKNPLLAGLTFSGGEPFCQPEPFARLADLARDAGLHIMAWSGYTYDQIAADSKMRELLIRCDLLIDGPFLIEQKDLLLKFRGSKNQRIIDVKASLAAGKAVETGL